MKSQDFSVHLKTAHAQPANIILCDPLSIKYCGGLVKTVTICMYCFVLIGGLRMPLFGCVLDLIFVCTLHRLLLYFRVVCTFVLLAA